jgi:ABC-type glycerol-3-phosphate transport system substrate-binding protein
LLALGAGCGAGKGHALRVGIFAQGDELLKVEALAGTRVKVEAAPPGAYETRLMVQFSASQAPDIVQVDIRNFSLQQADGWFLALSQAARERGSWPGYFSISEQCFALPGEVQAQDSVFLNSALFTAAGVDLPQPGWTWQELAAKAKALTKRQGSETQIWGLAQEAGLDWEPWVYGAGGKAVDEALAPRRCLLGQPAARRGLGLMLGLLSAGALADTADEGVGIPALQLFMQGRCAMLLGSAALAPAFKEAQPGWKMVPAPQGLKAARGWGWALSRDCRDPQAAWPLLQMLARKPSQDPSWVFPPRAPRWQEARAELDPQLRRAWLGRISLDAALAQALPKIDGLLYQPPAGRVTSASPKD